MDFLTSALHKLAEFAYQQIARQVGYVIFYEKNMHEFDEEVGKLQSAEETWRHQVEVAERSGEEIEKGVLDWLQKANEAMKEAEVLSRENLEAKTGCLNLRSRHKLSRNARHLIEGISQIKSEADFPSISYHPAPRIIENLPRNEEDFGSRVECFNQIMEALKDPDVSRIGVYGMGGVGKTTMVHQVAKEAKERKLFDQVVLATITQTPNAGQIQKEIADILGMTFGGVEGEVGIAGRLNKKLKDTSSLVILDDVWDKLDLRSIGIPESHKDCKILLSSRDLDVLSSKMDTQNNIGVGVLNKEEAWRLFKKKAELHDESAANSELLAVANDICIKCEGLPIAVVTIAGALKRKDISEWRDVLQQLQMPTSRDSAGMLTDVEKFIEQSYNFLGKELQSVFLLCSLMDYYIDMDHLFQYSVGLELFPDQNSYGLAEARNKLDRWIRQLKDKSLLQDFDAISTVLKMHDVVRDAAISIASRNQFFFRLRNQRLRQWPEKKRLDVVSKILLYGCDIEEEPPKLVCPELEFFLLQNQPFRSKDNLHFPSSDEFSSRLSDEFFHGMPHLKVLDLMCVTLTNLPASVNLRTLHLYDCLLENINTIGALSGLKVLQLSGASIRILPIEIGKLTQLQLLDLRSCHELDCIPENIISRLKNLEELYICDRFYRWGEQSWHQIKNASLSELMNLRRLTSVKLRIDEQKRFPQDLVFQNLKAYSIQIGYFSDWPMYDKIEKTLQINLDPNIDVEHGIMQLLLSAVNLNLAEWKGADSVLAELHPQGFPHLKSLHFANNQEIQYISSTMESPHLHECFPNLEILTLQDVSNFENICHGSLSGSSFSKLKELSMIRSPKMKSIISFNVLKNLHNLQSLQAITCETLETVFELDGSQEQDTCGVTMPLKILHLVGLPNLRHVWNKDPQGIAKFEGLCVVIVGSCPKLDYLFPASVAKNVLRLERLNMYGCGFKSVVAGGDTDEFISFSFPFLTELDIVDMPNLRDFYPRRYTTKWPKLRNMTFGGAYQVRNIFGSDLPSFNKSNFDKDNGVQQPCLQIEEVFPNLEKAQIYNIPDVMTWLGEFSSGQFKKTISLSLFDSHDAISPHSFLRKFSSLEMLDLTNCSFEEIFPSEENQVDNFSKKLRTLMLSKLQNLTSICKEGNPILNKLDYLSVRKCPALLNLVPSSVRFNNLTGLSISECHGLLYLLTSATAKSLLQLETLSVVDCSMIKEIIIDMDGKMEQIEFRRMEKLKLNFLGCLESFSSGNIDFKFLSLKKADLEACSNMKMFSKGSSITPNLWGVVFGSSEWLWEQDLNTYAEMVALSYKNRWELEEYPKLQEGWNGQLPDRIFINLRTLVVSKCESLSVVLPHNILKNLKLLEVLEVQDCSQVEVIFGVEDISLEDVYFNIMDCNLMDLKMKNLPNLKHIWNKDPAGVLAFENLHLVHVFYCESLKDVFPASIAKKLCRIEELMIQGCAIEEIVAQGSDASVSFIFPQLKFLFLWDLPNIRSFYPGKHTTEWHQLKKLFLNISSQAQIFGSEHRISQEPRVEDSQEDRVQLPLFAIEKIIGNLEVLLLNKMDFIMSWFEQAPPDLYSKLVCVHLVWFVDDEVSIPYNFLQRIPNLKELSLDACSFKEVCYSIQHDDEIGNKCIHLPLDSLTLKSLHKLEHICKEGDAIGPDLGKLKMLHVLECPCLKNLVPSSVSFRNLTYLEVCKCNGMVSLVSLETARGLVQLQTMKISECTTMKEIISKDQNHEHEKEIEFSELAYFELVGLSNLECFSSSDCSFGFPLLNNILIDQCPALKTFCNGKVKTPILQLTSLADGTLLEGDLNTIITQNSSLHHPR